jgi:MFS family permease
MVALTSAVMASLGTPLIPTIADASGVSLSVADWLLTVTLLTGAVSTPVLGRIGDGTHQRRIVVGALVVVLAGSIVAASTTTFGLLLTGRAMQGFGLGLLPVTMAIARRYMPTEAATRTIAILSVTTIFGIGLGYPLTGVLAEFWDFHAAFWTGAVVVTIALVAAIVELPRSADIPKRPFDLAGAVLMCGGITTLIVVLSEAERWGWLTVPVIGLFAASVLLIAGWARHELRTPDPLVDLRQTRHRMVLTANLAGFTISIGMYLFLPLVVQVVQLPKSSGYGLGGSVLVGACSLVPLSVGTVAASRLAVAFERRFGSRLMIPLGSLVFAFSMIIFALEHAHVWEVFVVTGIAGFSMGFTYAAMPGFIVRSVKPSETGSAMSFYQVVRSVGLSTGSALSAMALAAFTTGDQLPRWAGFQTSLIIGASLAVLTAVFSYVLPGQDKSRIRVPDALTEESAEVGGSGLALDEGALDVRGLRTT